MKSLIALQRALRTCSGVDSVSTLRLYGGVDWKHFCGHKPTVFSVMPISSRLTIMHIPLGLRVRPHQVPGYPFKVLRGHLVDFGNVTPSIQLDTHVLAGETIAKSKSLMARMPTLTLHVVDENDLFYGLGISNM
jgi:hypothetical protein